MIIERKKDNNALRH